MNWTSSLPLFPLGQVLYPGGLLSLQVFEVRYLDMISKAHQNKTPFGVVALKSGSEVRKPPMVDGKATAPETFFDVGTLASITQFESPQPGLIHIRCTGSERFHLMQRDQGKAGLWTAQAFAFGADAKVTIPSDLQAIADTLKTLHHKLQAQNARPLHDLFASPTEWDDCGWVSNRWCELMRLPLELKQRLMQLDNPLMRLELVGDLLSRQGILPKQG
jgi:Lon protease-like protein